MRGRIVALALAVLVAFACAPAAQVGPPAPDDALVADLRYISSPALDGRATGSPGNDSAVAYLTRSYERLRVEGLFPSPSCAGTGGCRTLYYQLFFPPEDVLAEAGIRRDASAQNIGAFLPGRDSALRGEFVVVGAHFDHLGRTGFGARDSRTGRLTHPGADDNASGTAALLELARRLAASPTRRSVALVHFGSEELGLFGSRAFVRRPPFPLDSAVAMLNIDMVGRMKRERVFVYGTGTSERWERLVKQANTGNLWTDFSREIGEPSGTSDHENFVNLGVPALMLTTGIHEDWHTVDDRFERLNLAGERRVVDLLERLVRLVADSTLRLRPARR